MKIFLTASPEVRAKRRYQELLEKGLPMTPEETGKALGLTVDQVVQREAKALSLLREEK